MPETADSPMFDCERHRARLSVAGCIRSWKEAQTLPRDSLKSITKCRGCPIGAANAGTVFIAQVDHELDDKCCIRCQSSGRKLVQSRVCISCYNRELEVLKKKNRRRTQPRLRLNLSTRRFRALVGEDVKPVFTSRVNDCIEAVVLAFRRAGEDKNEVTAI